jgi:uncharacterized protein YgfB (UPF0149 family)
VINKEVIEKNKGSTRVSMDQETNFSEKEKQELQMLLFDLEETMHNNPMPDTYYSWASDLDVIMGVMKKKYRTCHDHLNDLVLELQRVAKRHMVDLEDQDDPTRTMHSAEEYNRQMGYVMSELRALKSLIL